MLGGARNDNVGDKTNIQLRNVVQAADASHLDGLAWNDVGRGSSKVSARGSVDVHVHDGGAIGNPELKAFWGVFLAFKNT